MKTDDQARAKRFFQNLLKIVNWKIVIWTVGVVLVVNVVQALFFQQDGNATQPAVIFEDGRAVPIRDGLDIVGKVQSFEGGRLLRLRLARGHDVEYDVNQLQPGSAALYRLLDAAYSAQEHGDELELRFSGGHVIARDLGRKGGS